MELAIWTLFWRRGQPVGFTAASAKLGRPAIPGTKATEDFRLTPLLLAPVTVALEHGAQCPARDRRRKSSLAFRPVEGTRTYQEQC